MTAHDSEGLRLVRDLNALMAELHERTEQAGGWAHRLDPAWRRDWQDCKDGLLEAVREHHHHQREEST